MKKSKAYRAVDVKNVNWQHVLEGRAGQEAQVGLDIGKERIFCTLRWGRSDFEHPWRVQNPGEVRLLAERLAWLKEGRSLLVAMEPTGTYGDALRQALAGCQGSDLSGQSEDGVGLRGSFRRGAVAA